jgi:transcription elongation factor GreA
MSKISYITEEGLAKLKKELDHLVRVERPSISQQIAEARDKGDLSENAEYDAAKDAQGMLEAKINELEKALSKARIIDESELDTSRVTILSTVRLKNLKINKEISYTLVSETEANLKERKISVDSPIGQGLLGKVKGDTAEINTPGGLIKFEILEISL